MAEAAEFLAGYPGIPVIIDHAGSPYDQTAAGLRAWRHALALLAQLDHVTIKLSGFGMFDRHWSAASVRPMVDAILELFGVERVMFGSNFPVDKLMKPFDAVVQALLDAMHGLDAADQARVFSDNASRLYRL